MKFSAGVVAAITPMAALAFIQPTALRRVAHSSVSEQSFGKANQSFGANAKQSVAQNKAMSELKMAFNLKEGETSNMFEGPAPLVKERDACGVGFIANTQSGGKINMFETCLNCVAALPKDKYMKKSH